MYPSFCDSVDLASNNDDQRSHTCTEQIADTPFAPTESGWSLPLTTVTGTKPVILPFPNLLDDGLEIRD
jgi:hypothetical protein